MGGEGDCAGVRRIVGTANEAMLSFDFDIDIF
jgi:hypothetical protein